MDKTNYKVALQTLRKVLDGGFYSTDYAIAWIDAVLAGTQDAGNTMTPEVEARIKQFNADYPVRRSR